MVILNEYWQYGNTLLGSISILLIVFGGGLIAGTLAMSDEFSTITIVWVTAVSLGLIACGAVGVYQTKQKEYKVYLTDMSLDEFETEYDVTDIDGLIIEAYKKKEKE